jgi:predicted XRE-type DNA-binding protein
LDKGKIADFSLDALVNMLANAGMQVRMTVKSAA